MQRYFLEMSSFELGQTFQASNALHHHAIRVMRGRIGDQIIVVSQEPVAYIAELVETSGDVSQWRIVSQLDQNPEMPVEITIAAGLSKKDKLEWIVQKGTESGMASMVPVSLTRDVVKWKKQRSEHQIERLQKIAQSAAEQSHRLHVPTIYPLHNLDAVIRLSETYHHKIVAYEEEAKQGEKTHLVQIIQKIKKNDKLIVVTGSEGGLTPHEIEQLKQAGFVSVGLGPRILRAETAPLYLLHAVSYALELERGI